MTTVNCEYDMNVKPRLRHGISLVLRRTFADGLHFVPVLPLKGIIKIFLNCTLKNRIYHPQKT